MSRARQHEETGTDLVHVSARDRQALQLPDGRKAEMVLKEIRVDQRMTYTLPGGQAGVLSNVWDYIATERGITFSAPKTIVDTEDKIVIEVGCRYYNQLGQEVHDAETYEIDCRILFQHSRMKWQPNPYIEIKGHKFGSPAWKKAKREAVAEEIAKLKARGFLADEVTYDENDVPVAVKRKLPPEVEAQLWENFLTLKRNKRAKAITCAHRRLTQRAVGTKTLDPESLSLQFPSIAAQFSAMEVQQAVSSLYGDDEAELVSEIIGHQVEDLESTPFDPDTGEIVEDAEFEHIPEPANASDATVDVAAERQAILALAKQAESNGGEPLSGQALVQAIQDRIRDWAQTQGRGICGWLGNNPSLNESNVAQLGVLKANYEKLIEENKLAAEANF